MVSLSCCESSMRNVSRSIPKRVIGITLALVARKCLRIDSLHIGNTRLLEWNWREKIMVVSSKKYKESNRIKYTIIVLTVIIMMFSTNHFLMAEPLDKDSEKLFASLQEVNVYIQKIVLQHNSLMSRSQTKEEFLEMKEKLDKVFELEMRKVINKHQKNLYKFEGARKLAPNSILQVAWVGEVKKAESLMINSHLVIQIVREDPNGWKDDYTYLTLKLHEAGITPEIRSSFQGNVGEIMTMEKQVEFIQNIFTELDSKILEGITTDNLVSLSGYSKKLQHSIVSPNGEINVQIAARVNQLNQSTMITIGNPVIIMEY